MWRLGHKFPLGCPGFRCGFSMVAVGLLLYSIYKLRRLMEHCNPTLFLVGAFCVTGSATLWKCGRQRSWYFPSCPDGFGVPTCSRDVPLGRRTSRDWGKEGIPPCVRKGKAMWLSFAVLSALFRLFHSPLTWKLDFLQALDSLESQSNYYEENVTFFPPPSRTTKT